jgi:hypothetical protein
MRKSKRIKREILALFLTFSFISALAQTGPANQRLVTGSSDLFGWIFDVNVDNLKKVPPASEVEVKPYYPKGFFQSGIFDVEVEPASYAGDKFGGWEPDHSMQYWANFFSENQVRSDAQLDPCFATLGTLNQILNPPGEEKKLYLSFRHSSQRKEQMISTGANTQNLFQRLFVRVDDQLKASEPKVKAGDPYMSIIASNETIAGRVTSAEDLKERGLASSQKILESFDFCASKIQADKGSLQRWQKLGRPLPGLRRQVVDLLQISRAESAHKH